MEEDERLARVLAEIAESESEEDSDSYSSEEYGNESEDSNFANNTVVRAGFDHTLGEAVFTRDHFEMMITMTFESYYPKHYVHSVSMKNELLKLIDKQNLIERFRFYFCSDRYNILTMETSPWLDYGDLPLEYVKPRSEIFKKYS
jgi:hypothetical protein